MNRRLGVTVLWLLMSGAPAVAAPGQQPAPAAPFELLAGAWSGTGSLFGGEARFSMDWRIHGDMAVQAFRNATVRDGVATTVLEAVAVYRTDPSAPEGVWLDGRGERIEIRWEATDSVLVANWTASSESGRTTYRIVGPDRAEVVDEVLDDDAWRTFARATYRRDGRSDP